MLLKKKINNNFVLAVDNSGTEVIANGKGLGFKKLPCVLNDLSEVERTFYNFDRTYSEMIVSIPDDVNEITSRLMKFVDRSLDTNLLNPNLYFIMADHINFCIERKEKGIHITMPLQYDLLAIYPTEVSIGKKALEIIKEISGKELDEIEAYGIAMNLINARIGIAEKNRGSIKEEDVVNKIVDIIETYFGQKISRDNFNYSRFAMHTQYLIDRLKNNKTVASVNKAMVKNVQDSYPQMWNCTENIANYLKREYGFECSEEEKFYLLLHINRMLSREI